MKIQGIYYTIVKNKEPNRIKEMHVRQNTHVIIFKICVLFICS